MKSGSRTSWTKEREKALLKLGRKADVNKKVKDWQHARECCPRESEILKDFTNTQLRKTYTRILKASQGLCVQEYCRNKTDGKNRYCEECRKKNAERALTWWNKKGRVKRNGNNL